MAKPKAKETVVWDDEDVWADLGGVAESEPATQAAGERLTTVGEATAAQWVEDDPGERAKTPATVEEVKPQAEAAPPEIIVVAANSPKLVVATLVKAEPSPVVQIRRQGISLVKRPVELPAREVVKEPTPPSESQPPPLPKTWFSPKLSSKVEPSVSLEPVGLPIATAKPPPLPMAPPPPMPEPPSVARETKIIPLRKPPTGISPIFTRAETAGEKLTAREPSTGDEAVPPVIEPKREVHPKLGPAFSRGVEADP